MRLLQSERPVYFNARDGEDARFVGLSTDPGFTGDGAPDTEIAA